MFLPNLPNIKLKFKAKYPERTACNLLWESIELNTPAAAYMKSRPTKSRSFTAQRSEVFVPPTSLVGIYAFDLPQSTLQGPTLRAIQA